MNENKPALASGADRRFAPLHSSEKDQERWLAVLRREDGSAAREFVYGVKSTGVYCRAHCPSKRPNRAQVSFFDTPDQAEESGFRPCLRCRPQDTDAVPPAKAAVLQACAILDAGYEDAPTLGSLAQQVGLSPAYLQRAFVKIVGVSPREYAAGRRMERFRAGLRAGEQVGQALVEAGYGSTSRIYQNKAAESRLGASPRAYKSTRFGMRVRYTTAETRHGWCLIAATERGICAITLGDNAETLSADLLKEYPAALAVEAGDAEFKTLAAAALAVSSHLAGAEPELLLPLDIRATAFQMQVWKALQAIPYGETRSYADIAAALKRPTASRAVARACASNPVALLVPCHRVIRGTGEISGYRWGVERKKALLSAEKDAASKQ